MADGVDKRVWEPRPVRKSVGAQSSWGVRFETDEEALTFVRKLSAEVGGRLHAQGLRGQHLTLKLWRAMDGAPEAARKGTMVMDCAITSLAPSHYPRPQRMAVSGARRIP